MKTLNSNLRHIITKRMTRTRTDLQRRSSHIRTIIIFEGCLEMELSILASVLTFRQVLWSDFKYLRIVEQRFIDVRQGKRSFWERLCQSASWCIEVSSEHPVVSSGRICGIISNIADQGESKSQERNERYNDGTHILGKTHWSRRSLTADLQFWNFVIDQRYQQTKEHEMIDLGSTSDSIIRIHERDCSRSYATDVQGIWHTDARRQVYKSS